MADAACVLLGAGGVARCGSFLSAGQLACAIWSRVAVSGVGSCVLIGGGGLVWFGWANGIGRIGAARSGFGVPFGGLASVFFSVHRF